MRRLLLVLLIFAGSCSGSDVPDGVLPPEKMEEVFWDYIRADVYANEYIRLDSGKNVNRENAKLQQQVFDLHKVSRKEFYDSYEYYLRHQDKFKNVLDTMLVRQQKANDPMADTSNKIR